VVIPFFYACLYLTFFSLCSIYAISISERSAHPIFCQLAADNEDVFANFKSDPIYRQIIEHVSYETGLQYLNVVINDYPDLLPYLDKFRQNDSLGNPITYSYGKHGIFSPTTLRYVKMAGDLRKKFGDLSQMHIVEIGGGYGGQCTVLSTFGFASYTLIDLPECIALSKKYLDLMKIKNVFYVESTHLENIGSYDLVISNYAFSEINKAEQLNYLEKVIKPIRNGYMTLNFISGYSHLNSLSIEELVSILYHAGKSGKVEKEHPLTHPTNLLMCWKPSLPPRTDSEPLYPRYNPSSQQNAITYKLSGGRFGDDLIAYFRAKWIAYKYGLPFLYSPFPFSDQFAMADRDTCLNTFLTRGRILTISNEKEIANTPSLSSILCIPYCPECRVDYLSLPAGWCPYIKVDWDDPKFKAEIVKCLTLKKPIETLSPPHHMVSLGVHVRRGGGVDNYEFARKNWPLKFPPDSYYIQQIRRVAAIFHNRPLYVYIFTDSLDPQEIVEKYKKILNNPYINLTCRQKGNSPHNNILTDFFSMTKFDCFIRCQSNFSIMATKLANHSIMIAPLNYTVINNEIVVNETELTFRGIAP
jgi:hypothetical protein